MSSQVACLTAFTPGNRIGFPVSSVTQYIPHKSLDSVIKTAMWKLGWTRTNFFIFSFGPDQKRTECEHGLNESSQTGSQIRFIGLNQRVSSSTCVMLNVFESCVYLLRFEMTKVRWFASTVNCVNAVSTIPTLKTCTWRDGDTGCSTK